MSKAMFMADVNPGLLPMWVVYDHPTDYPDSFVARLWYCIPEPKPQDRVLLGETLDHIRMAMEMNGFVLLRRNTLDDPAIVETWL